MTNFSLSHFSFFLAYEIKSDSREIKTDDQNGYSSRVANEFDRNFEDLFEQFKLNNFRRYHGWWTLSNVWRWILFRFVEIQKWKWANLRWIGIYFCQNSSILPSNICKVLECKSTKGGFFSESAISFSDLQISKKLSWA